MARTLEQDRQVTLYMRRYGKTVKDGYARYGYTVSAFSSSARIFETGPGAKCVFSADSYRWRMLTENRGQRLVMAEALITTYPSKNLKRKIWENFKKTNCLHQWQLEAMIEVEDEQHNKTLHNLMDFMYDEDAFNSDDVDKRCAGTVQIVIPIKDPIYTQPGKTSEEIAKPYTSSISNLMKFFGYDYSDAQIIDCTSDVYYKNRLLSWVKLLVIAYEAVYQTEEIQKPKYLYHLTTKDRLQNILKKGLRPKSESTQFKYPDRVYVFNNVSMEKISNYIRQSGKPADEWYLLRIDTSKIPHLHLYIDNMYSNKNRRDDVMFTYNPILPNAIVGYKSMSSNMKKKKRI